MNKKRKKPEPNEAGFFPMGPGGSSRTGFVLPVMHSPQVILHQEQEDTRRVVEMSFKQAAVDKERKRKGIVAGSYRRDFPLLTLSGTLTPADASSNAITGNILSSSSYAATVLFRAKLSLTNPPAMAQEVSRLVVHLLSGLGSGHHPSCGTSTQNVQKEALKEDAALKRPEKEVAPFVVCKARMQMR
ncbi:hypothetical protein JCM11251_006275 [Rhodosporidiobolus azoricus]